MVENWFEKKHSLGGQPLWFCAAYGTAKAVPFQNGSIPTSPLSVPMLTDNVTSIF